MLLDELAASLAGGGNQNERIVAFYDQELQAAAMATTMVGVAADAVQLDQQQQQQPPPLPPPQQLELEQHELDPIYAQFRDQTRFWIQRVAVPMIMVVGLFGNLITVIIMTRRRMRSTTNMYLAALAFVDMLYLVLTFLLGLSHYPNMAQRRYYAYWRLKPFLMMLTDACSNTSVWLTVTFTIERFIAVRYPMRGKLWCTEARAKRQIVCVFLFAILFTLPVPFEWVVIERWPTPKTETTTTTTTSTNATVRNENNIAQLNSIPPPLQASVIDESQVSSSSGGGATFQQASSNATQLSSNSKLPGGGGDEPIEVDLSAASQLNEEPLMALDNSDFGRNETYKTIYYWSTAAIFYFIPLLSLTFFNGFLIHSVHQSRRERNKMTNRHPPAQPPPPPPSQMRTPQSHEQAPKWAQSDDSNTKRPPGQNQTTPTGHKVSRAKPQVIVSNARRGSRTKSVRLDRKATILNEGQRHEPGGMAPAAKLVRGATVEQMGRAAPLDAGKEPIVQAAPNSDAPANVHKNNNNNNNNGINRDNKNGNPEGCAASGLAPAPADASDEQVAHCLTAPVEQLNSCQLKRRSSDHNNDDDELTRNRSSLLLDERAGAHNSERRDKVGAAGQSSGRRPSLKLWRGEPSRASLANGSGGSGRGQHQARAPSHRNNTNNNCQPSASHHLANRSPSPSTCSVAMGAPTGTTTTTTTTKTTTAAKPATAATQTGQPATATGSSQERRITIMLISVVILFLVCQIPSAAMLLYTSVHETIPNTNEHALLLAFGNIFNFLMAVNAAGNFILYSFLSKKYRRTFVILFCGCFRRRKSPRSGELLSSSSSYNASGTGANRCVRSQTSSLSNTTQQLSTTTKINTTSTFEKQEKPRWTSVRFAPSTSLQDVGEAANQATGTTTTTNNNNGNHATATKAAKAGGNQLILTRADSERTRRNKNTLL